MKVCAKFRNRPVMGNRNSPAAKPVSSGEAGAKDDHNQEPKPVGDSQLPMANPLNDKSAEYRAVKKCYDKLIRGINPDDLTSALFSEGVISQSEKEDAGNYMFPKGRRTTLLVDAVMSAVDKDRDNFRKFIHILRREAAFARVAEMLQGKRCKFFGAV